jgi:hypothetical protein
MGWHTISITPEEVRAIEAEAEPVRQKVRQMMATYRAGLGNSNGEGRRTVGVEVEPVKKPEELAPIVRRAGDENSSVFWSQFAGGTGERPVEKACAIFAVKTIVDETVGRGLGNQAIVAFRSEQPTVADVLAVIDRLCGGPVGWQHLQRKAEFSK